LIPSNPPPPPPSFVGPLSYTTLFFRSLHVTPQPSIPRAPCFPPLSPPRLLQKEGGVPPPSSANLNKIFPFINWFFFFSFFSMQESVLKLLPIIIPNPPQIVLYIVLLGLPLSTVSDEFFFSVYVVYDFLLLSLLVSCIFSPASFTKGTSPVSPLPPLPQVLFFLDFGTSGPRLRYQTQPLFFTKQINSSPPSPFSALHEDRNFPERSPGKT